MSERSAEYEKKYTDAREVRLRETRGWVRAVDEGRGERERVEVERRKREGGDGAH